MKKDPEVLWKKYLEANREMWNEKTRLHKESAFYDVRGFLDGRSTLNALEKEELGSVRGKKLLHLQCHFGLDTLSWARQGAGVTGIDFSEASIQAAREIQELSGLEARFIHTSIYELPEVLEEGFDVVFTSYGVLGWLPDLDRWARVVHHFLNPGGVFYIVEFHPIVWMFDPSFTTLKYPYDSPHVIEDTSTGTYAAPDAPVAFKSYGWNHGLGKVVNALIQQGLHIEFLHEHFASPYNIFPNPVQDDEGNWMIGSLAGKIPMLYSIRAKKKLDQEGSRHRS